MQKIVPYLWFDGNAAEAAAFYTAAFPGARSTLAERYPTEGLLDFQQSLAGEPLSIDVEVADFRFSLLNAGPEFRPNRSVSFLVSMDARHLGGDEGAAREMLDAIWGRLADGGEVLMPLGEYPYSPRYGWVEDRYGVSWQLILADPAGDPRPFLMPDLLFGGPAQNRAHEAIDVYCSLFPDSGVGRMVEYTEQSGPAVPGAVMFADFRLAGVWFAAMDAARPQDVTFSEGNSFAVLCDDQVEIDRLWAALSAVPEAEQCGWCIDRFGLSWQIVPAGMAELMSRPGAFARMLEMKKIVIADL